MKRILMAFLAASLAFSAFADADEDRVLDEARRRADRDRSERRSDRSADRAEAEADRNEEGVFLPVALSILPGSPIPGKTVDAAFGFGLIISVLRDVDGVQVSGIGSVAGGSVNGAQAAGIFSVVEGDLNGFQAANIFNTVGGEVNGFQASNVFNVAEGPLSGAQMAGVFNIADGGGPAQFAGVFNIAEDDFNGVQAAGVFNIAEGDINGIQAAGVFNVAEGELRGLQIGLVNVADSARGFQIGLINIVHKGINDAGVWFEDSDWAYGFWQKGTSNTYTLAYLGAPREDWFVTADRLAGGFGFGVRIGGRRSWTPALDLDVSAKGRVYLEAIRTAAENRSAYRPDFFPSARASLRIPVGLGLAVHAGIVLDTEIADGPSVGSDYRENDFWEASMLGLDWTFHPKLFAGFSF